MFPPRLAKTDAFVILLCLTPDYFTLSNTRPFYKSKYERVGVLPIQIVKSNILSIGPSSERNLSPMKGLSFSLMKGQCSKH